MKLLKFWSETCGPCIQQNEEFKKNPIDIPVESINIEEEETEFLILYNVSSIPKIVLLDDKGKTIHQWIGYTESWIINSYIKEHGNSIKE